MKTKLLTIALLACFASATSLASSFEDGVKFKSNGDLDAASRIFQELLTQQPNDRLALEQLAVVQGWQGKHAEAIASWQHLIEMAPEHVDARIGLARVEFWAGDHAAATSAIDAALAIDANSADALTLSGDVLAADAQPSAARAAYERARAISGDAALDQKIAQTNAPSVWRLDIGALGDHYTALRGSENAGYAQIGYRASDTQTYYVRADRFDNFGTVDFGLTPGAYVRIGEWLLLNGELGITPDSASFRPGEMLTLNADVLLQGRIQPLLGLRYSRYDLPLSGGNVLTVTPGARLLFGPTNLELRYGMTENLDDTRTAVAQAKLTLEREYGSHYLFMATGEEATPPLPVADINVFAIGSIVNLDASWSMRIDLVHEDRKDAYVHNTLGFGFTYRF